MKDINKMTRKELEAVPFKESWNSDVIEFNSLVILPLRKIHDSGFRCMDFVAVLKNEPICRLSGWSDIIHLDGIGGLGYRWSDNNKVPDKVPPSGWNIDCLHTIGLLRLFTHYKLIAGQALSSFEIYTRNCETPSNK